MITIKNWVEVLKFTQEHWETEVKFHVAKIIIFGIFWLPLEILSDPG